MTKLPNPQPKPKKKKAKNKVKAVAFQYCFGCKEVQELSGDQCSVCFNYIVF